jgi:eukaryotic-like serine/threonine-protein kinase
MHSPDPRIGTVLHDRYRVEERMSEGSMGAVYRAERIGLKRQVAIKFLNEGYAASEDGMRRFEVEARAMSRLNHPNCVSVTDFGLEHGQPYLVMDFVTGRTLRQVLAQEWRVEPARALEIVRQVLAGLAHAHAQDIVHRDVKPENILLAPVEGHGEQVRIVDFGLAKLRDEGSITTGVAVGTPSYMSPEQTMGHKVDERADVYATGVILFELLTGEKPFKADSVFEVLRMHREVTPPTLSAVAPNRTFSPELEDVVRRALAKDRAQRFTNAAAFLSALSGVPEARASLEKTFGQAQSKSSFAIVASIAAAVLLVGGGGLWWWRHSLAESPREPEPTARVEQVPPRPTPVPPPVATPPPAPKPVEAAAPADAAVAAEAAEPGEKDPTPNAEAGPAEAEDVVKLRAQASNGDVPGAVRALEALRAKDPNRVDVRYALGNLYAELQTWAPAVQEYAAVVGLDPSYRKDARLVGDVVEALASDKAITPAAKLIRSDLREAALPRLEEASRSSTPKLRARARKLRAELKRH